MNALHPVNVTDILAEAGHGLLAHRLRTTLSSIGIVFGVATVVASLAVAEGARREAIEQIGSLGINNVLVRSIRQEVPRGDRAAAPQLRLADADVLRATVPAAVAVSAIRTARITLTAAPQRQETLLVGATAEWQQLVDPQITHGRWLVDDDIGQRRRVAVLGETLARGLFGDRSPLGRRVSAAGDWYEVVGVLATAKTSQSPSAAQRFDPNQVAVVPFSAMDVRLGSDDAIDRVEEIGLRASGPDQVSATAAAARAVLERRHPRNDGAYELVVPRELLRARMGTLRTFNAVLMGIGGLALLISGIGIMNIMLASVAERTAEIGVRRAFGATRLMVVAQFAMEASLLCVAGGLAGIFAGVLLAEAIAFLAGWRVSVSFVGIATALAMAAGVGLGFGIYPAHLAGRLDPAEALRAP